MLDPITTKNILLARRICLERDFDCPICLDGGERNGKSSLLLDWILTDSEERARDIDCAIFEPVLDIICWTWEDWHKRLAITFGDIVPKEESLMLGRRAMSDDNVAMIGILTTCGKHKNRMPFLFPDFNSLEPYIRKRTRIRGYVHVKFDSESMPIRGYVLWYVQRRYPWKRPDGETTFMMRAYTGRFTHIAKDGELKAELWARFGEREDKAKASIIEDTSMVDVRKKVALGLQSKGWTIRDIAELFGVGKSSVGEWVAK